VRSRRLLIAFAALLVGIVVVVAVSGGVAFSAAAPSTLEAAKHSASESHTAITEDEARTMADRKRAASADSVVSAIEAEAPKEPPVEEVKETTGSVVSSAPLGPVVPAGGWHVAFADGFGKAVGAGDTFWRARSTSEHPAGWKGCCNNSNETGTESPSAVHWSEASGLELHCEVLVCSGVNSANFRYELGRGATFAFQAVAQFPNDSQGGDDPGFWSCSSNHCTPEFDLFEWWAWNCEPANCLGGAPVYKSNGFGTHELYFRPGESGWTRFHTYTTVVEGSTFTEYIDGTKTGSFTQSVNTDSMNLILTHAIRVSTKPRNSSFNVRSIAVYESSAQAGQFVTGGGIAPGTVIAK
jgi:hypothetical protein